MKQVIRNKNDKGQYHGYQEWYFNGKIIAHRYIVRNGQNIGYSEWHGFKKTNFYIR
jgi:hypothetical protein